MAKDVIEIELYDGTIKIKFIDYGEKKHAYYVAEKLKGGGWSPYGRGTGVTTYIGIKDKSQPLKFWVARIMHDRAMEILEEGREITREDVKMLRELHLVKLEKASTAGTKIHNWIEAYIKGEKPPMPQEQNVLNGVNAFLDWMKAMKVEALESEVVIYSKKYHYLGKLDLIARIGKKRYLLDFKTSKGVYNDVMLQTAAYQKAYEEAGGKPLDGRYEIRLEQRSEEEFRIEMDGKGKVNAVYKIFEPVLLDTDVDEDFKGFLAAQELFKWNKRAEVRLAEILGIE